MAKVKKVTETEQPAAHDFEKLGVFYLGRPYDMATKQSKPGWLLYDSKDLVTHAVCVGMTGSGKTGLCIGLLEEAAIDGIPALIIDPKGDLANLMLNFPQLRGEDFAPWVNEDDARKKGLSSADYATQQAEMWKKGLGDWGQSGERIQKLRDAADVVVYTPGSNAGIPVSILKSFAAPSQEILDDPEMLRERIGTTVTSLLGLIGVEADPIKSREHILLSTILDHTWKAGRDLDLATLIQQIQTPPIAKIGVLDLDSFYPSKERFTLAMQLNNLLASPGFSAWLEGEALDPGQMLHSPGGKPRLAIFSIAHLNDAERMFFVTLLLSQTLGWVRAQSGTTSLRAILYMDEIFGYFPPVANPPSKQPLLTLLKQARAFGLGVVLATQNPVDLDYKGLANTGTWFIGRLQTERDKARVLEGLEGASASSGKKFDKQGMEQLLAGLGNRVFLMNNVHEDAPEVFQTRWTLSYLRGPLTRTQIKTLMEPVKRQSSMANRQSSGDVKGETSSSRLTNDKLRMTASRPMLPPDVPQHFIPVRGSQPSGSTLIYQPMLLGASQVRVSDSKAGVDVTQDVTVLAPISDGAVAVDWDRAVEAGLALADLESTPTDGAQFAAVPSAANKAKSYETWNKDFSGWLFRNQKVELFKSPSTKEVSKPDESERDFRVRLQQAGREARDKQLDSLRQKYAPKIAAIQDRIRRAGQMVERQQAESRSSQMQAAISVGASILGAFLGRKTISASNIGRATTAIRGAGRAIKESKDVGQAEENVSALQQQLADLESQFKTEADALAAATDPLNEKLETVSLKPTKANIAVKLVALAWTPHWRDSGGAMVPAWS
ncbi:MAG: ATP-binding protein [Nitrospira sp.]|nr:ATP-binding protein [Nitrospira sp.]TKB72367.1 MAG: ATP-binding protein [Nitrospira sp.]